MKKAFIADDGTICETEEQAKTIDERLSLREKIKTFMVGYCDNKHIDHQRYLKRFIEACLAYIMDTRIGKAEPKPEEPTK